MTNNYNNTKHSISTLVDILWDVLYADRVWKTQNINCEDIRDFKKKGREIGIDADQEKAKMETNICQATRS